MPDIEDGQTVEVQGSAKDPYILKNTGGVYSCSCPAWRNQSTAIEARTCKHLRKYLGEEFEKARLGGELPSRAATPVKRSQAAGAPDDPNASAEAGPPILLAHSWDGAMDLAGWWMSEKLDGVRAYWDGTQFISRQGNTYLAPDWFIADLPKDVHLDGELWMGRKAFQKTVSIVRRQDKNADWKEINYVVFDAPQLDDVFEARVAYIQQMLDELQSKYVQPHLHIRCTSVDHLREELARVEELGGEGLMLRQPGSKYEQGRSFSLLKVKTFHDAEATVIEHLPGTGKHKGRMGALAVKMADGTQFSVGTGFSDAERMNPPPVGSMITFRYQELSDRGVPRFPSFVRMRTDVDHLPPVRTTTSAPKSADTTSHPPESVGAMPCIARVAEPSVAPPKAAPHPKAAVAVADVSSTGWRKFEMVEGTANKFWQINIDGTNVTVKYGRIGTQGQEKTKSFPNESAANSYAQEIISEKTEKGYNEV